MARFATRAAFPRFLVVVAVMVDGDEVIKDENGFGKNSDDGKYVNIIDEPEAGGENGNVTQARGVAGIDNEGVETGGDYWE